MAVMELWRRRDLEGAVKTEYVDGNFFTQDSVGNLVGVKVYSNGAEVALTGSVTGYCVLPSGETVSVAGTRSGNQASILVPQSALAYTGPLGITLKLIDSNTITTLMSIIVVVYRSKTDTVITPSSQIITDWANQISAALQEVEDASAAQDAKIADLKSAITHNEYISEYISFLSESSATVTPSITTGKMINRNGEEIADAYYNIASFVADKTKIYRISALTGNKYANLRSVELVSNGVVVAYDNPTANGTLIRYIKNYEGTVRVCYRAASATSIAIVEQALAVQNEFDILKYNIIDPDDYAGTDSQKIQLAMAEIGDTGHGVILIKRKYTLTSSINISHDAEVNARIIFMGTGSNCGFDMGQYRFRAADDLKSYGMISFENVCFVGTGAIFAADYLLRVTFTNCIFSGGTNAVRNERYMQSWTFIGCTFRDFSAYVIYSVLPEEGDPDIRIYDIVFNGCLVERCAGFLYTNKLTGCSIMQCCIEGLTGYVCNIVTQARSLSVIGNYFEHNNNRIENPAYESDNTQPRYIGNGGNGVHFNFERLVGNLSTITIASNNFVTAVYAPDTANNIILLPPNKPKIGYIAIQNNDLSYAANIYLVKAYDTATDIYTNVLLSGNTNGAYNGGENNLIIDLDRASIGNVTEVKNNTLLSGLTQPGLYFIGENITVNDRPSDGDIFVLNIRSDESKAQLAITSEGIKTRLNDGEWI